ncbi:gamma-tubulin complex component protein [Cokeromyces recurvatus]|uniref:gamma-tubulin complex component protein n=1 Tax=Cokeromyces recurvatus TaxID=90255 RepID=UPI00221EE8E4|nr:gamma-tubulin complex component protein [Cokeromyces recurvatus]KAI7904831.1 gamma-tubulin complex component protein [Cokeromyces recurvatus]
MSQFPSRSSSIRSERNFKSSNVGTTSSSSTNMIDTNNMDRRSILLSPNQLNRINRRLANIRYETASLDGQDLEQPIQQSSTNHDDTIFSQHTVGDFSVKIQEYAMIEDVLFVLMGIDGTYIKCNYPTSLNEESDEETEDAMEDVQLNHSYLQQGEKKDIWEEMKYTIDPTLDPSIKHLVEKILPLATFYLSLNAFVEQYTRYEYGTVNHALCAGIRAFLKDYMVFVAQLEHEFQTSTTFTLQRLWFYAQDYLQTMKILNNLVTTIRSIKTVHLSNDEEDNIDAVIEDLQQKEIHISERIKGGSILNILSEKLIGLSGDPKCKKIYTFLLSKASIPYFDILNSWIYRGEINDPYNEFMILEKKSVKKENLKEDYNDTYWETRYTIREAYVPFFLEPIKDQILLAGKFLNVVRECGVEIANPDEMQHEVSSQNTVEEISNSPYLANNYILSRGEVWTAVDGSRFIKNLEIAYKYANQKLLNLLMKEQQLLERLRSLKHYFFLDQSDFITSFLDLAKDELNQPASEIPQSRLQSLMDLVLRNPSSVAAYDPFKEDVKVTMSHLRLVDQLIRIISVSGLEGSSSNFRLLTTGPERSQTLSNSFGSIHNSSNTTPHDSLSGYDALVLDYTVTFPLSLIISRKALTKYQLLFRYILNLKHVEELLCGCWMDQKHLFWKSRSSSSKIEKWKFKIFSLRNRMLTFVQQIAYYVTNEVLEPNWRRLEANLSNITTVDQVLQYHSDFLDSCLKECMLTNSKLLRVMKRKKKWVTLYI